MENSQVLLSIGFSGLIYWILTLQLSAGFPPFYEKGSIQEEIRQFLPQVLAVLMTLIGVAMVPLLFVVLGLLGCWFGILCRNRVRARTNGPLNWTLTPLTVRLLGRWPMLLLDAWTVGITLVAFLLILNGQPDRT